LSRRFPAVDARGTDPEVHDDVDHGAAGAYDVFRLAGRHIREVDTPPRHRAVHLCEPELLAENPRELVVAEPFEELPRSSR
jgi:hypothetical protein